MNTENIDRTFSDDSLNSTSNRRRVRVKFAYSFDNDRILPITQTTVIKTEPCFKVTATEDNNTKQFYYNKSQFNKQRTISQQDSLEEVYYSKVNVC